MPPTRASRRVAARRKPVVEISSDSEPEPVSEKEEPDQKEDTPPPTRRRQSKRSVVSAATPASASRATRAATRHRTQSIERLPRNRKKRTPPTPARNMRVKRLAESPPDEDEEGEGSVVEESGVSTKASTPGVSVAPSSTAATPNRDEVVSTATSTPRASERPSSVQPSTVAATPGGDEVVSTATSTPRASERPSSVQPSTVAATPSGDEVVSTATSTPRASERPSSVQPSTPVAQTPAEAPTTPPRPLPTPSKTTPRTEVLMDTMSASQTQTQRPQSSSSSQRPLSSSSQNEPRNYEPVVVKSRTNALLQASQEPVIPKQRLVITHLVMENFKSYAGQQLVGPFHASFSSVVGPNGSGKSNVIDSLLFVFGFRASKMRQGKISALIHNSAAHPNLNFCEVQVHFHEVLDLPDGCHEVIPNSKLVISRRAFKTNSSTYFIDGRKSDYTEVTTLLRGRGVDLDHKRFLILQGEVESIAQMKPKAQNKDDDGLLEYLEDIIGTSRYKQPIEESANQTEELNEVCVEKSNRVQHVEKERNSLEGKKNAALEYILAENEIVRMKSTLFQFLAMEADNSAKVTSDLIVSDQAKNSGVRC
jgi:structural maintenance of chromosome 4